MAVKKKTMTNPKLLAVMTYKDLLEEEKNDIDIVNL